MNILKEAPEPLPQYNHCGIHMTVARLVKHRQKARSEKSMKIRLRWRAVDMMERWGLGGVRAGGRSCKI